MFLDDRNQPMISISYKNSSADAIPLYIPNCGLSCPLKKMFLLYEDILPVDWEAECKLSTLMMTYEEANMGLAMGKFYLKS